MSRPGGAVTVRAARNASRPRATVPGTKPPRIRPREGHLQSATHSCVTYGPYVTQNPEWTAAPRISRTVQDVLSNAAQQPAPDGRAPGPAIGAGGGNLI